MINDSKLIIILVKDLEMDNLTFTFFIFEMPQQFPTKISIKNTKNHTFIFKIESARINEIWKKTK